MIVVLDQEGFQVFQTDDNTLLPRIQEEFPNPPFTITNVGGPLAGGQQGYSHRIAERVLRHRAIQLRNDINSMANLADVRQAMLDLLQLTIKTFQLLK